MTKNSKIITLGIALFLLLLARIVYEHLQTLEKLDVVKGFIYIVLLWFLMLVGIGLVLLIIVSTFLQSPTETKSLLGKIQSIDPYLKALILMAILITFIMSLY